MTDNWYHRVHEFLTSQKVYINLLLVGVLILKLKVWNAIKLTWKYYNKTLTMLELYLSSAYILLVILILMVYKRRETSKIPGPLALPLIGRSSTILFFLFSKQEKNSIVSRTLIIAKKQTLILDVVTYWTSARFSSVSTISSYNFTKKSLE